MSIRFRLIAVTSLCLAIGCEAKQEFKNVMPPSATAVVSKESAARLEEADKADGTADHVIGKCYVCGLGMNGSEKFTVKVGDYQAHLCSEACQQQFTENAEEIVAKTEIPSGNKSE
ncbi:MAG: hypothetical protein SFV81_24935 [Pirellulaceae bacterium]|nr:hypothetical protein [Pirellulaceae bacterium]